MTPSSCFTAQEDAATPLHSRDQSFSFRMQRLLLLRLGDGVAGEGGCWGGGLLKGRAWPLDMVQKSKVQAVQTLPDTFTGYVLSPRVGFGSYCHHLDCNPPDSSVHDFSGKNTGVGFHGASSGVFSTRDRT